MVLSLKKNIYFIIYPQGHAISLLYTVIFFHEKNYDQELQWPETKILWHHKHTDQS